MTRAPLFRRPLRILGRLLPCLLVGSVAPAAVKQATPANYRSLLSNLQPGDVLELSAGVYERGLPITGCHGTAESWITIQGPAQGTAEIRQTQVANCVELRQCSYVALKRLSIQGGGAAGMPGLFGISAQGGLGNSVHHILVEDCVISDWNTSQQSVGISTKTPTWGWTIRRNVIRRCGTGLYLGNSNGEAPFIQGIIEHNLIQDPIGYCMEIKYQKPRPALEGMPTTPGSTIIRHNVFIKNDAPSPDGDRANLLVGGFPESGPGSSDLYEIYGNFFWHNPRESLLQASGRVSIHDNVFADAASPDHAAIVLRDHDLPLKLAQVYHNTVCGVTGGGLRISSEPREGHAVLGNVIFAGEPLRLHRSITHATGNITGPIDDAVLHLINPRLTLGEMDLRPKPGHCEGEPLDLSSFASEPSSSVDFGGHPKGNGRVRGAYSSVSGIFWPPQAALKPSR